MSSPGTSPLTDLRFDAVLFDMDGTLIDSIPAVERSWLTWCAEYGVDPVRLLGFHGVPAAAVIAGLLPQRQRASAHLRIREIEIADTEGIRLLPGAAELLADLESSGAAHAIVTSCTDDLAAARIAATGLRVPEVVVTASDVTVGKPAPDPYLEGARRLGVDPARCLVVEDAGAGIVSARAAGCAAVVAVTSTTGRAELEGSADVVVDGLDQVSAVVRPDGIQVTVTG
jgi:sugar-phosphatase